MYQKKFLDLIDYHFIIKELANKFVREFGYLGEIQKSTKLFQIQYKKKLQKLIKMVMQELQIYLTK